VKAHELKVEHGQRNLKKKGPGNAKFNQNSHAENKEEKDPSLAAKKGERWETEF